MVAVHSRVAVRHQHTVPGDLQLAIDLRRVNCILARRGVLVIELTIGAGWACLPNRPTNNRINQLSFEIRSDGLYGRILGHFQNRATCAVNDDQVFNPMGRISLHLACGLEHVQSRDHWALGIRRIGL